MEHEWTPQSFRINLVSFRTFRCLLFRKSPKTNFLVWTILIQQNDSNCVFLPWKPNNPYYHILHPSLGKLALGQHLFWSSVLIYFAVTRAKVPIYRYKQTRMLLWKSFTLLCQMAGRQIQVILFEIDCAILYTNLHELLYQYTSWTNWVKIW